MRVDLITVPADRAREGTRRAHEGAQQYVAFQTADRALSLLLQLLLLVLALGLLVPVSR